MKTKDFKIALTLLMVLMSAFIGKAQDHEAQTQSEPPTVKKMLVIGDSMSGWIGERFGAYGNENGFEVATIVWDGSTISKWANSPRLKTLIAKHKPDVIVVSLGLNELFTPRPESLATSVAAIEKAFGDTPFIWMGPPSWPGKMKGTDNKLDTWLAKTLGSDRYFSSLNLDIARQSKTNPHPSKAGIKKWVDSVVEWIPENTSVNFKSLDKPQGVQMKRGKTFIYRTMKQAL